MLNAKTAVSMIIKYKNVSLEKVLAVMETPDLFIIAIKNDEEGYDTVNKHNGEIKFMWTWDYADEVDANRVNKLDLNVIKKEAV